ncbi:MAG: helix-turn-helix transcriptional regulator [Verrucomicrobiales bacterium]|nr:helix-turn-helix transcriptional regulator [Verrucomicrobiae bacterium]
MHKPSRELVAASSKPLVLAILSTGESYGYDIIQRVKERSGGNLQWTDGMLYPLLHRLEQDGLIRSSWKKSDTGRERKYYKISKAGLKEIEAQKESWRAVNGALEGLWSGEASCSI